MTRSICLLTASLLLACSIDVDPQIFPGTTHNPPTTTDDPPTGSTTSASTSDGSSDASSAGSGDSTTLFEPFNCDDYTIEAWGAVPRVMLVLDKSGSMVAADSGYWDADADDADDDGLVDGDPDMTPATPRTTRWHSLHAAIGSLVGTYEPRMDFGAVLFPAIDAVDAYDETACVMNPATDVPVAPDQGAQILATIPLADSLTIAGATPTSAAMLTARAGLTSDDPAEAERTRYIVLVTDSAANCPLEPADATPASLFEDYDDQLPQVVADAHAAGIPTFVVGLDIADLTSNAAADGQPDNTNTYTALSDVAIAGGTENFYNAHNQLELQAALTAIAERITPCTFSLGFPFNPYFMSIFDLIIDKHGPAPLVYDRHEVTDCANESGWHFTDETRSTIELCGAACTLFKQTGNVEVTFWCESI